LNSLLPDSFFKAFFCLHFILRFTVLKAKN
jgi:hypothetical protein